MPRKTFVYPHPINAYIIKQLGITVEEFCELHAFSQGTVSSWITRNKKIETLPISFIYSLSLSASKTMDHSLFRPFKTAKRLFAAPGTLQTY